MKKKFLLILFIFSVIAAGAYGQAEIRAKNNISLHFGVIGAELSYERMLNRHFSVLADVSYTTMLFIDEFTASAKGRAYPFGGIFYLDLGLGFTYGKGVVGMVGDMVLTLMTFGYYLSVKDFENDDFRTPGFLIQPGLGWKIDIGKDDGFVLPVSMGADIKINDEWSDFMPYLRIGLGYSF